MDGARAVIALLICATILGCLGMGGQQAPAGQQNESGATPPAQNDGQNTSGPQIPPENVTQQPQQPVPEPNPVIFKPESCMAVAEPGTYLLQKNVVSEESTCFSVVSSDVVFDCQQHEVTGMAGGYAFKVSGVSNVTIKNCAISDFDWGISFANVRKSFLLSNRISNGSKSAIYFLNSDDNLLDSNELYSNVGGMQIFSSSRNRLTYNKILGTVVYGILVSHYSSRDNVLEGNRVCGSGTYDLYCISTSPSDAGQNTCSAKHGCLVSCFEC
ncbi:MAG: right-handed parallel beta-helix repeat-containing protein [Candidatus Micrarchaeota archaeon]|nr:right-handed parallel beta-helix repeat-containing protein [Candidatus Micrarchaeota archaeon]